MSGSWVSLDAALDARRFGGKAAGLAASIARRLPVPDGVALDVDLVDEVAAGDPHARVACADAFASFGGACVAVRSSAVGEDGGSASFAGQHATRLGVTTLDGALEAIAEVRASAESAGAFAYREKIGIARDVRMGVVVQRMVDAECAGVMFTKNPIDGADERVIEAAWGLGEVVVAGRVVPDRYRLSRSGAVLASTAGDKDVAIRLNSKGETVEHPVRPELRAAHCLDAGRLAALSELAMKCDEAFEGPSDIEWAFQGARLYLLQRRPVTR